MIEKNKVNNDLGRDDLYKLLVNFSIPAILSMLVAAVYNMVDRIFVGNVNPLGLSAIGVTMPFQILQMAFVLLIGVGSSTLISIKYGEGDLYGAKRLLSASFKMIVITETVISFICIVFLDEIFWFLGISESLYDLSRDYIIIILMGGMPSLVGYCLNNSVRSLGFSRESMIIVILSSIMNIVLDYIFVIIFGMGVKGAAIATVISQSSVTVFVLYFFSSKYAKSPIKIELNSSKILKDEEDIENERYISGEKNAIEERETNHIMSIVRNGLPNFYMQIFGTFVNIKLNSAIIGYGNEYHMATVTIIVSISQIFTMIIYGISQGMQPIVGFNFGNKQIDRSIKALKISLFFVFLVSSFGLMMIELFPDFFTRFFTKDEGLIELANYNLRIYLIGLPMIGIHSIATTFLQSIKNPKMSTLLYILRYGGILVPCLMILPKYLGINGVYISKVISDALSGLISIIILYYIVKQIENKENISI